METLKELKAIIAGKPEGATHIAKSAGQSRYLKHNVRRDFIYYDGKTFCVFPARSGYLKTCKSIRSLSDIERIIELMEQVKSGYEAYTRIEATKQRYNGENKHKTNLLIDAEKLLRGGAQEHCNHLADVIEEVLK